MLRKLIIVFIVAIIIIIIAVGAYVFLSRTGAGNSAATTTTSTDSGGNGLVPTPSTPLPTPTVMTFPNAPQGSTFQIGTSRGVVTVNNFYNTPVVLEEEFLILEDNNNYQINYDTETSQFVIYFTDAPAGILQSQAENNLMTILGTDAQDTCKLNVSEEYPGNSAIAPQGNNMSFCG